MRRGRTRIFTVAQRAEMWRRAARSRRYRPRSRRAGRYRRSSMQALHVAVWQERPSAEPGATRHQRSFAIQVAYGGRLNRCAELAARSSGASVRRVFTVGDAPRLPERSSDTVCACAVKFMATTTASPESDRRTYDKTCPFWRSSIVIAPSRRAGSDRRNAINSRYQRSADCGSFDSVATLILR